MSKRLEAAEITLYAEDGYTIMLDLDPMALAVMLKAIGFKYIGNGKVTQFGPNTLDKIYNGKINPFTLKEEE